jgi:hypothetical protein
MHIASDRRHSSLLQRKQTYLIIYPAFRISHNKDPHMWAVARLDGAETDRLGAYHITE